MFKNTVAPLATQLFNKVLDAAFALFMLRILGPEGAGSYAFAGVVVLYLEIAAGFGLDTLITRDIAREASQGPRYLWHAIALRSGLWVTLAPVLWLGLLLWQHRAPLGADTLTASGLLIFATLPSLWAGVLSRIFYAHERMEIPALVSVVTTLVKVGLGLAALLAGLGIVGLASVAVANNLLTVVALTLLARTVGLLRPFAWQLDRSLLQRMLVDGLPLFCNNLLAAAFFRVDVLLLQAWQGATVVGWYTAAYKVIDAALLLPSALTLALFPAMARQAASAHDALQRSYHLAVRYLLAAAFPLAAGTTALAEPIAAVIGGRAYLPHSAIALQWLIWFLPLSYVNGVTQYVLIALGRQRCVTVAFLIVALFNVAANAVAIPLLSYRGAALVTVLSEVVLFVPFARALGAAVRLPPLVALSWRPLAAALTMAGVLAALPHAPAALAVGLGIVVYSVLYIALGGWTAEDRRILDALRARQP